jgi:hypothetical protein
MSQQQISRSQDLIRLRNEGYDIEWSESGYLILRDIPYVDVNQTVQRGILVSSLELAGDITKRPEDHVVKFSGTYPCSHNGEKLTKLVNAENVEDIGNGVVTQFSFSHKLVRDDRRYVDYYEKLTTYVGILLQHAQVIDNSVVATTYPVVRESEPNSVFKYTDTASSRVGIVVQTQKLAMGKVAIVGLGGTGSYILDLVAKTPINEIRLYDGDVFSQHNAFRSPGAPSIEVLNLKPNKAEYFKEIYSNMRHKIIAIPDYISPSNIEELRGMDFVFLSLDQGASRREIVEKLSEWRIPFIDVGMGIQLIDEKLQGMLRATTCINGESEHITGFAETIAENQPNEYSTNIQIADLNSLNAALAVVKWKKICGFYADTEKELACVYTIDGNYIGNETTV